MARVLKVENVAGLQTCSLGRVQHQRVEGPACDLDALQHRGALRDDRQTQTGTRGARGLDRRRLLKPRRYWAGRRVPPLRVQAGSSTPGTSHHAGRWPWPLGTPGRRHPVRPPTAGADRVLNTRYFTPQLGGGPGLGKPGPQHPVHAPQRDGGFGLPAKGLHHPGASSQCRAVALASRQPGSSTPGASHHSWTVALASRQAGSLSPGTGLRGLAAAPGSQDRGGPRSAPRARALVVFWVGDSARPSEGDACLAQIPPLKNRPRTKQTRVIWGSMVILGVLSMNSPV